METKPWYMTSESWVLIISQILGILSMTGVLTPDQSDTISKNIPIIAGALVSIASAFGYTWNRTQVKQMRTTILTQAAGNDATPDQVQTMFKSAGV